MLAHGASRPNPVVAVAEALPPSLVRELIDGNNLWPINTVGTVYQTIARSPEDLSQTTRFSACLISSQNGREWLGGMVRLNCDYFIECFSGMHLGDLGPLRYGSQSGNWDFLICLSTRSAYHLPTARKFVTALRHRGIINDAIAPAVEMAVQEAFANSLIHGNLELDTSGRLSMNRFDQLGAETERRLASAEHGERAILLTAKKRHNGNVVISINDQGKGFIPPEPASVFSLTDTETTFGRGLPLIRSICKDVQFNRGGRSIELTFKNDPTAIPGTLSLKEPDTPDAWNTVGTAKILIADDTLISREIIASYLRSDGFTNLVFAKDGEDTLEQAAKHNPDLIILDIIMPKRNGYDVCKALRADPAFDETPIIAQTALEEHEGRTRIFTDGATDLILKPLNKSELIARTRIHLENRLLVKQLQTYRERTQSELELARDMQENLNPKPDQYRGTGADFGLRISAAFQMSSELGGDMWGLVPLNDQQLGVYIVDFAGHGLGAALNTFRLHSLIWSDQLSNISPGGYLERLNRHLKGLLPVGQYATMLYGVIDRRTNMFSYATAACPAPILGNAVTGDARFIDGSGLPLGIVLDAVYETREVPFGKDDFLLLYSDALIETTMDDGQFLSEEKLLSMLADIYAENGRETDLAAHLTDLFMDRAPSHLSDDFTVVSLQRNGTFSDG